ncbi:hypothetical protein KM043_008887 [Ampulex compressa]|nr:hypothetical protein KM043_008887 [Ampulex compressa]
MSVRVLPVERGSDRANVISELGGIGGHEHDEASSVQRVSLATYPRPSLRAPNSRVRRKIPVPIYVMEAQAEVSK